MDNIGQVGLAPTDVAIQKDTGNIALDIVEGFKISGGVVAADGAGGSRSGLIAAAAANNAVGQVVARRVDLGVSGSEVMHIRAAVGGRKGAEALRPNMLAVPYGAVPRTADGVRGIQERHLGGAACRRVGILRIGLQIRIGRDLGMRVGHQCLQARLNGRSCFGREGAVCIGAGVICLSFAAERGADDTTRSRVIRESRCTCGGNGCNQGEDHYEREEK